MEDFRDFLKKQLLERSRQNPKYSLRAFARHLEIEPSLLSKLLAGKRAFAPGMIARLAKRLGLSAAEVRGYLASSLEKKLDAESELEGFQQLSEDRFRLISEWYYFPILDLLQVSGFEFRPHSVAGALGLSREEARAAIDRLERLGMIGREKGRWLARQPTNSTLGIGASTALLRKQQKQFLEKAIRALEDTPPELRDQSTVTMAIDKRRLPAAKEKIKAFRRDLCKFLEAGSAREEVYMLSVSLFPVSQIHPIKEKP